jgi:soluble lytic murein transglycosylase-like protein
VKRITQRTYDRLRGTPVNMMTATELLQEEDFERRLAKPYKMAPAMKRRIRDYQRRKIAEQFLAGQTMTALARKWKIPKARVYDLIRREVR